MRNAAECPASDAFEEMKPERTNDKSSNFYKAPEEIRNGSMTWGEWFTSAGKEEDRIVRELVERSKNKKAQGKS